MLKENRYLKKYIKGKIAFYYTKMQVDIRRTSLKIIKHLLKHTFMSLTQFSIAVVVSSGGRIVPQVSAKPVFIRAS